MTDEIIAKLSRIKGWKVISRTSVMRFKNSDKDIKEIGQELDVVTILEGSVPKEMDDIRVTTQLINVEDSSHLWSEIYDRKVEKVFDIQSDISEQIAKALKEKLSPEDRERLEKRPTENLEAYNLYLKGRYFWEQRGEGLNKALELFERAIELDPDFVLAHAGFADACVLLSLYGDRPVEIMPRARSAAERAVELDPSLAEAHSAVALISFMDWDWARANQEFLRAIKLNPSYAPAHNLYGQYLLNVEGRAEEAVRELERTIELDPLNAHALAILGLTLMEADRLADALAALRRAKELDPTLYHPRSCLVMLHLRQSRIAEAVAEAEALVETLGRNHWTLPDLAAALAADGRLVEAEEVLNELLTLSGRQYVNPTFLAIACDAVGKREDAFQWLNRAYRERDPALVFYCWSIRWSPEINSDIRFRELRRRMGLN